MKHQTVVRTRKTSRLVALGTAAALLGIALVPSSALAQKDKLNRYAQVNLVSDVPDLAALTDPDLVNPWGMAFSSSGPFWVSDNGTGKATIYAVTNDSSGVTHVTKQGLVVSIPGEGVTGQVFDGEGSFNGDIFLFVTEDGTISGWRGDLGSTAEVLTNRPGAVYLGVTIATSGDTKWLLAANFHEGTVDVYDTSLALVNQFSDPDAPEGYAPFNVQAIDGMVFVMYAKQDEDKEDEVAGPGFGFIDTLDPSVGTFERFATGTDAGGDLEEINAPWGVALAPDSFGKHAGDILVGNFGSGTIMAFDSQTGEFQGLLKSVQGPPVVIEGLWAIAVGNGGRGGEQDKLYFTAGIDDENHGLFGSLEPASKIKHNHPKDHDED